MTDRLASNGPASAESISDGPTTVPPTDIYETKDGVVMLLDMPGADPESLNVTLDKHVLTVAARSASTAPQGYTLVHAEYQDGNYQRVFSVSDQVDSERIDATFKDGVLRLTLPKMTPSPAKKIAVKAA
jgi:HSP20 family molecular chaperone IbpA